MHPNTRPLARLSVRTSQRRSAAGRGARLAGQTLTANHRVAGLVVCFGSFTP